MSVQLSVDVRNSRLDAIETVISTAPTLELRTGPQPSNCASADTGIVLATFTLPSDWLAAAVSGSKAIAGGPWQDTSADATGTAGHFRIKAGGVCHVQGTVGLGSGDLQIDSISIVSEQTVSITSFTLTDGNAEVPTGEPEEPPPETPTESAEATVVPDVETIVDAFGVPWTIRLSDRKVMKNGMATSISNALEIWYLNHTVYVFDGVLWKAGEGGATVTVATIKTLLPVVYGLRVAVGPRVLANHAGIQLSPGDNVQNIINANPAGTTYVFGIGTYNQQSLIPKAGDQFIGLYDGSFGAVLDGQNVTQKAFSGSANYVVIRNLFVRRYTAPTQRGIVENTGTYCIVQNNEISEATLSTAVYVYDYGLVIGNKLRDNAQQGYALHGDIKAQGFTGSNFGPPIVGATYDNNEIYGNNPTNATWAGAEQGGGKSLNTINANFWYNYSHDNKGGPQFWFDFENYQAKIWYNKVRNASSNGIEWEISFDGDIWRNDLTAGTVNGLASFFTGACIHIGNSGGNGIDGRILDVHENILTPNQFGRCVAGRNQNRGSTRTITGITQANPAVVTHSGTDVWNGGTAYITGVVGMTQVNSVRFRMRNVNNTAKTFELETMAGVAVNSTGYGAYTSGGSAQVEKWSIRNVSVHNNTGTWAGATSVSDGEVGVKNDATGGFDFDTENISFEDNDWTASVNMDQFAWKNAVVPFDTWRTIMGFDTDGSFTPPTTSATVLSTTAKNVNFVLSNGNLTAASSATASLSSTGRATNGVTSGKWYWEIIIDQTSGAGYPSPGIGDPLKTFGNSENSGSSAQHDIGYRSTGAIIRNNTTIATIGTFVQGDVICVALDYDAGHVWFRVNGGNWNNNVANNPVTDTGGITYNLLSGGFPIRVYPFYGLRYDGVTQSIISANFAGPHAHTAPSGFGLLP